VATGEDRPWLQLSYGQNPQELGTFDRVLNETEGDPEGEGSVVAIEPRSGKVLAMVSLPTFDPNALAGDGYLALGAFTISPDHRLLGYSLDTSGDEIYRLFVKDLGDGHIDELPFDDCDGQMTWANDSRTLFFVTLDDTHRPHRRPWAS
jgi:protease II